jgi:hypothetical protein
VTSRTGFLTVQTSGTRMPCSRVISLARCLARAQASSLVSDPTSFSATNLPPTLHDSQSCISCSQAMARSNYRAISSAFWSSECAKIGRNLSPGISYNATFATIGGETCRAFRPAIRRLRRALGWCCPRADEAGRFLAAGTAASQASSPDGSAWYGAAPG